MGKYDDFLRAYFSEIKGLLGSELSASLMKQFGISPENARKVVQRVADNKTVWSTKPLSFGRGQYFYFHPDHYPDRFMIMRLAKETRPPLYRLLNLLEINSGVLSFHEGLKVSSSPEEGGSSKVSLLKDMVNDLAKLKIVVERKDISGTNFILHRNPEEGNDTEEQYNQLMVLHQERMKIDTLFIPDLLKWLSEANMIATWGAYRNFSAPGVGSSHNKLTWDAYGYTKTTGINPGKAVDSDQKEKQTLVVMDIVINRTYSTFDLNGFIARIQINNNSVKDERRKVVPIVVYNDIEPLILTIAKKLGFIVFSMKKIYGSHIGQLIENIKTIYGGLKENVSESIESALCKISASGQMDQLADLRGRLFEALMNPLLSTLYPKAQLQPDRTLKLASKNQSREFDYILTSSHPKELILVELKGYAGDSYIKLGDSNTKSTLRYFFRGSVPLADEYYKNDLSLQNHKIKAVFITTGNYHSECTAFISSMNGSKLMPSKFGKCVISGDQLLELLNKEGFDHEARIIQRYYINKQDEDSNSD